MLIKMADIHHQHSMMHDFKEIIPERDYRLLNYSLDRLDSTLKESRNNLLVGSSTTLADLVLTTEVDQLRLLENSYNLKDKWSRVYDWISNVKESVSGYEETHEGLNRAVEQVENLRKEGKL